MIHEAIYNLYPEVKSIEEDKNGNLTILNQDKNIVEVDMSAVKTKATELQQTFDAAITNTAANKTSATNKLKALGLTDAEIEAL